MSARKMRDSSIVSLTVICILPMLLKFTGAVDQVTFLQSNCSEKGQYSPGSVFQNNLYMVLSNLTSKAYGQKFYNFSTGEAPNKVYGLFLCASVYLDQVCQDCVTIAAGEIQRRCDSDVEATVWYAECMLRYADRSIFSLNDDSVYYNAGTGKSKFIQYSQQLSDVFSSLFDKASIGDSSSKSASTVVYLTKDLSLSCYVDCTLDLSESECKSCLSTGLGRLELDGAHIGRLLQPSCRLMYIYTDVGTPPPDRTFYITLSISSAIAAVSLLLNVAIICCKRKARKSGLNGIESKETLHFDFGLIKAATGNFSLENKLGQGGFGVVYMVCRVVLIEPNIIVSIEKLQLFWSPTGTLADGKAVAVKRLSNTSGQGIREFKAEACLAAKLKHKNLVKLYGFCVYKEEMILVYEYLPNNSLDQLIFDPKQGETLRWETRYQIIVGIVRGLLYLHEDSRPKIVHRDLKPSNILLDENMNPKIADFGMAKLFGSDQTQGNTSRVAGTFGYMAPEYSRTGNFSAKSDIFSLGVIILEIISGLRNSGYIPNAEEESLIDYAERLWEVEGYATFVDSKLGRVFTEEEAKRCMNVGLQCIQEDPAKRPDIASVLLMLNSQPIVNLPLPSRPPESPYRRKYATYSVRSYESQAEELVSDLSPR